MALTNCTINSTSVEVTPSQALGSGVANQVLTITPNTGFRVAAADFTQNTDLTVAPFVTQVQSITLTNSGVAYAANNTVVVTVDLKDTFNPGTSDTTITIDIDGAAVLEKDVPKTLSGVFNVAVTNAATAASNQAYTATDVTGTTKDLFTRTVTANSGNYFEVAPTCVVATGDVNNYVITTTPNGSGTSHTATTFDVDGIIPLITDTADVINISAVAQAIPAATNRINSYSMNTSSVPLSLTKRQLAVYGDVGAKFTLEIKNAANKYWNFTSNTFQNSSTNSGNLTIASNGQHLQLITFPLITVADTYTFTIANVSPTTLNLTQTNPFTVSRVGFTNVTVNATSTSRGTFQSKVITYTDHAGTSINQSGGANATIGQAGSENESDNSAEFNFNIVIDDDQAFTFSGANALSNSITLNDNHFTQTGNAEISVGSTTATRSADGGGNTNQLLTLAGSDWYNWQHGTGNTVINFNIDEFCDAGGGGGGGSNVLTINSTQFQDITSGSLALISPSSFSQTVTGRTSGSTTIQYTLTNVTIDAADFPSFVNTSGDMTVTATTRTSVSTNKFDTANFAVSVTSFNVANAGTGSRVLTFSATVTITSFSPAVTSGDELGLKVMLNFVDDGATP